MKLRTRRPVVHARQPRRVSPLKADPSRTASLRRQWVTELRARFRRLRKRIAWLIVERDALGLVPRLSPFAANAGLVTDCGGEGGKPGPCPKGGASPPSPRRRREQAQLERKILDDILDDNRIHGPGMHTMRRPIVGVFADQNRSYVEGVIDDVIRPRTALAISYFPAKGITVFHSDKGKDIWLHSRTDGTINISVGGMARNRDIPKWASKEQIVASVHSLLNLKPRGNSWHVHNEDWRFRSDPEKVKAFEAWLRQQLSAELLGLSEQQVWERFVRAGLEKGAGRAFDDVNRSKQALAASQDKLDFYAGTRDEFLRSAFGQPVAVEKVKLLAGRTFGELNGVAEAMATQMTRTLVDGLVQGQGPREIARELNAKVGVGLARAETIARSEIIRSHAEGQLTAFEQMGIEEVGAALEWTTAMDSRVCPKCKALEGVVLKVAEARGRIPAHPNCRCAWLPAMVGEDHADQKTTKAAIDSAAGRAGVDLDVSRERPQSILDDRRDLRR